MSAELPAGKLHSDKGKEENCILLCALTVFTVNPGILDAHFED